MISNNGNSSISSLKVPSNKSLSITLTFSFAKAPCLRKSFSLAWNGFRSESIPYISPLGK